MATAAGPGYCRPVKLRPAVLALVIAIASCAAPAAASAATETATSGPVTATLTYKQRHDHTFKDLHLKIVRDGVVGLDQAVTSPDCSDQCRPLGPSIGDGSSVAVRDLDGDGEPEVVLDLYTGGAHCCWVTQVFELISPGSPPSYAKKERNFLDPGYTLKDLNGDGIPEFRSADGRFAYVISSYAGSGVPIQILRFQNGDFADVTRQFPALIRRDSKHWWKQYRRYIRKRPPDNDPGLGGLAAWAGDEYLLGHGARVERELKAALKRGWLRSSLGSGRRTLRELHAVLDQNGYR